MEKQIQNVRDLIYFFTHNKNLTREQQVRRDKLLARDCFVIKKDSEDSIDSTNALFAIEPKNDKTEVIPEKTIRYISPNNLHSFLYDFNQNNILKYTCHEIDTDEVINEINKLCDTKQYCFSKHTQLVSQALDSLLNDYKRRKIFLDNKFIAMLKAYICGSNEKGWSSLGIKTSWKSEDLLDWSDKYDGIVPSPGKNIAKKQKNNGY